MTNLHGTTGNIDKDGVLTLQVKFYLEGGLGDLGEVPERFEGLRRVGVSLAQAEEGAQYVATARYEGKPRSASYPSQDGKIYRWEPTYAEEDIRNHPQLEALLRKYEGRIDDAGEIAWAETLKSSGGGGLGGGNGDQTKPNPALGLTRYFELGGVWSETSVTPQIPQDVFSSIGRIRGNVPGGLKTPAGRFWLTLPPQLEERGAVWTVTRRWQLSGPNEDGSGAKELARDLYGEAK